MERGGRIMYRFSALSMNSERRTDINPEELEDDGFDDENDFFCPEDDLSEEHSEDTLEDDEPYEREYCD